MSTPEQIRKDIAGALDCISSTKLVYFVEFKQICITYLERFAEITKGIEAKLTVMMKGETKPLWYLVDYLVSEMPLVFQDEFKTELPSMVDNYMPWDEDEGMEGWGAGACKKLVESWGDRGLFDPDTMKKLIEIVERRTRGREITPSPPPSPEPSPIPTPAPRPQPELPKQTKPAPATPMEVDTSPSPNPVVVPQMVPPPLPESDSSSESDFYDPNFEMPANHQLAARMDKEAADRKMMMDMGMGMGPGEGYQMDPAQFGYPPQMQMPGYMMQPQHPDAPSVSYVAGGAGAYQQDRPWVVPPAGVPAAAAYPTSYPQPQQPAAQPAAPQTPQPAADDDVEFF